ncbi:MAG: PDZ domain-containing protein, partial [Candidatus Electrothrix sp. ATG1]|nr:PDZ domain-containing protein [Candidatus Electrothrix sp. ATG1]
DDISQSRIIYVGETHTDYGAHLLQLQVLQALWERLEQEGKGDGLVIGMEMFPRTSQHALDGYINGTIPAEQDFLRLADYYGVWGYDYRMYRDIINYAKARRIPILALNLNKDIVSTVYKTGSTDELTPEQLTEVAPDRVLGLTGYRKRLEQVHAQHKDKDEKRFAGFFQAQAMWDETMAASITAYLQAHPEKKMLVLAGTGHVYKDSAVPPRVARRMQGRQSVLIANNGQVTGAEKGWQADYLMFTEDVELPPAGKIGVVLKEVEKSEDRPSRVEIIEISPLGKAGEAGLQQGDVILAVDNAQVATIGDLKIALLDKKPGETVQLNIVRKDKMLNSKVELSDMEKAAMLPPGHPKK